MKIKDINISELRELGNYDTYELKEIASKMILNLQLEIMDFCNCGCPNKISFMIRDILRAIKNKQYNWDSMKFEEYWSIYNKELYNKIGIDSDHIAFEFILHTLNSAGVLEHGSIVGGSWLTVYGEEILCAFDIVEDTILDVDYWEE